MKKLAFLAIFFGLLSTAAQAQDVLSLDQFSRGGSVAPIGSQDCSNGIVIDDGTAESGIAYLGGAGQLVNVFSLGNVRIVKVCLALVQVFSPDGSYDVVIFDDDGAGGEPGTELGRFSDTAKNVPVEVPAWYSTYTDVLVSAGDYYVGQEQPGDAANALTSDTDTAHPALTRFVSGAWGPDPFSPNTPYMIRVEVSDPTESRATFEVFKDFDDGNPAEVEISIECTTGDPISQSQSVTEATGPIEFIVKDFDEGELDCLITETVPEGYSVSYNDNRGNTTTTGCLYQQVDFGQAFGCEITNSVDQVDVVVDKVWVDDLGAENGSFLFAGADWSCSPVANRDGVSGDPSSGNLTFYGSISDPWDYDYFSFYPHYDGSICSVTEREFDPDIISDDSDCDEIEVFPGYDLGLEADDVTPAEACTIVNTRIFAGIPTLSEMGLALLALLMLSVGLIGFRRFS